jgi:hypothetical protein
MENRFKDMAGIAADAISQAVALVSQDTQGKKRLTRAAVERPSLDSMPHCSKSITKKLDKVSVVG